MVLSALRIVRALLSLASDRMRGSRAGGKLSRVASSRKSVHTVTHTPLGTDSATPWKPFMLLYEA